jgi:hypothetical protein
VRLKEDLDSFVVGEIADEEDVIAWESLERSRVPVLSQTIGDEVGSDAKGETVSRQLAELGDSFAHWEKEIDSATHTARRKSVRDRDWPALDAVVAGRTLETSSDARAPAHVSATHQSLRRAYEAVVVERRDEPCAIAMMQRQVGVAEPVVAVDDIRIF